LNPDPQVYATNPVAASPVGTSTSRLEPQSV
jgi:hypothetical protein